MATMSDPVPELCRELVNAGWSCPASAGAQFTSFSTQAIATSDDVRSTYRLGFLIEVPLYQTGPVILKVAIERCDGTSSIIIFDYKDAKFKINHDGRSAAAIARDIVNLGSQALPAFGGQLALRILAAEDIQASLEECLVVNNLCNNFHYKTMRIDDILTAHRLVSPADKWSMYRKQANTPNTKMNLVDALSEYAATLQDTGDRFELSTEAGDLLISRGDLEARPAWHYWE